MGLGGLCGFCLGFWVGGVRVLGEREGFVEFFVLLVEVVRFKVGGNGE